MPLPQRLLLKAEAPVFLTEGELRELTGYIYHCRQIDWLRRNNWKFEVSAQQRPKVARSYFDSRLGSAMSKSTLETGTQAARPNFESISQVSR